MRAIKNRQCKKLIDTLNIHMPKLKTGKLSLKIERLLTVFSPGELNDRQYKYTFYCLLCTIQILCGIRILNSIQTAV